MFSALLACAASLQLKVAYDCQPFIGYIGNRTRAFRIDTGDADFPDLTYYKGGFAVFALVNGEQYVFNHNNLNETNGRAVFGGLEFQFNGAPSSDDKYLQVNISATNPTTTEKTLNFSYWFQPTLENNKYEYIGVKPLPGRRGYSFFSSGSQYQYYVLLRDALDVDTVDRAWYGSYDDKNTHWNVRTDEQEYSPRNSGIALTFGWNGTVIKPGQSLSRSFLIAAYKGLKLPPQVDSTTTFKPIYSKGETVQISGTFSSTQYDTELKLLKEENNEQTQFATHIVTSSSTSKDFTYSLTLPNEYGKHPLYFYAQDVNGMKSNRVGSEFVIAKIPTLSITQGITEAQYKGLDVITITGKVDAATSGYLKVKFNYGNESIKEIVTNDHETDFTFSFQAKDEELEHQIIYMSFVDEFGVPADTVYSTEFSTFPNAEPTVELSKDKETYVAGETIVLTATIQDTDVGDDLTLTVSNDRLGTKTETFRSAGESKTFSFTFVANEPREYEFTAIVRDQGNKQSTAKVSATFLPQRTRAPPVDPRPRPKHSQTVPSTLATTKLDLPTTVYNGTNFYMTNSYVQYETVSGDTYVIVEIETSVLFAVIGNATPTSSKDGGLPWWIFVIIGGVALVLIISLIAFFVYKKRHEADSDYSDLTVSMQEEDAVLSPQFLSSVVTDNPLYTAGEAIDDEPDDVFKKDFDDSDHVEGVFVNPADGKNPNIFLDNGNHSDGIYTQDDHV